MVDCLNKKLRSKNIDAEIILIDDNSDDVFNKINSKSKNEVAQFITLHENIGRAAIRNLFLKYTNSDNMLFLDCDSEIANDSFLEKYLDEIKKGYDVVCGGRIYPEQKPPKNKLLHWKYGVKKESKNFLIRSKRPYRSFMTNNFLIKRNIFEKIHFNEAIRSYGHEDTLFGYELYKSGIEIRHIDNVVLHGCIETNKEFLVKTKTGILNLIEILPMVNYDQDFIQSVSLLRFYFKLRRAKLDGITYFLSTILIKPINTLLQRNVVKLWLFDLLKLSLFANLYRKSKHRFK